jgi:hypothetical protein
MMSATTEKIVRELRQQLDPLGDMIMGYGFGLAEPWILVMVADETTEKLVPRVVLGRKIHTFVCGERRNAGEDFMRLMGRKTQT